MQTDRSAPQVAFEGFGSRQVVGNFDGGAISSNGGAVMLREADRAISLTQAVARCVIDRRDPDLIVHRIETLLAQRIHGLALGYEDLNDHEDLRHDPVLGLLSDRLEPKRADCAPLAGKSTLNRLEHGLKGRAGRYHKLEVDEAALETVFLDLYVAAHKTAPKRIVLDLDATDDPLHGNQEGRFYHGYYRGYCYLPLYIFDGRHLLVAKLRPANIDAAAGAKEEIARIVAHVRKAWPEVEIWLRADSGFTRDDLMSWCEENGVDYVFGMARNKRLERMIEDERADAKAAFQATGKPARRFKELTYRTKRSWSKSRRVVAPFASEDLGRASGEGRQPALHRDIAVGQPGRGPGFVRENLLRARRDGEPHQGVPTRSLCRSHLGRDPAREPVAVVVRFAGLCPDGGGAAAGAGWHRDGQCDSRFDPPQTAQARSRRDGQRAPHQARLRHRQPDAGTVRCRCRAAASPARHWPTRRRRGQTPPAGPRINSKRNSAEPAQAATRGPTQAVPTATVNAKLHRAANRTKTGDGVRNAG